jgi:hypothetical protein
LSGDFNSDGVLDLVVANNGDGRIALLLGGDGLTLQDAVASGDLPHPTALAFAHLGSGILELYVSTEGREAVDRISLSFNVPVAELVPLEAQELALVATLLSSGAEPPLGFDAPALEAQARIAEAALAAFQPELFGVGGDIPESEASRLSSAPVVDSPVDELAPLIWGEDEAWERLRRQALERLMEKLDPSPEELSESTPDEAAEVMGAMPTALRGHAMDSFQLQRLEQGERHEILMPTQSRGHGTRRQAADRASPIEHSDAGWLALLWAGGFMAAQERRDRYDPAVDAR